ncbi:MAG: DUF3106 domain-containing protein [Planctomycetes bacterium]|nr:DUF3106 domain-containing protein [Planctomycetota bacterium]
MGPRAATLSILLLLTVGVPAQAQSVGASSSRPGESKEITFTRRDSSRSRERLLEMEERWKALSETEKERLRAAFGEFKSLSPEKREEFRRRGEQFARERDKLEQLLPAEDREQLQILGGEIKSDWLRALVMDRFHSRWGRVKREVPSGEAERALQLDGAERVAKLRQLFDEASRSIVKRVLDQAESRKMITPEESARLAALPPSEAAPRLLELRKLTIVSDLERKPERRGGLSESEWESIKTLPPEQFFEQLDARRVFSHRERGGEPFGRPGPHGHGEGPPKFMNPWKARLAEHLVAKGLSRDDAHRLAFETPWEQVRVALKGLLDDLPPGPGPKPRR